MEKTNKNSRLLQVKNIINRIPDGRKTSFKRLVQYELADSYGIVMSESQLSTFLQSGYSSIATEIIEALEKVVNQMIKDEEDFQAKIEKLQAA